MQSKVDWQFTEMATGESSWKSPRIKLCDESISTLAQSVVHVERCYTHRSIIVMAELHNIASTEYSRRFCHLSATVRGTARDNNRETATVRRTGRDNNSKGHSRKEQ